MQNGVHCVDLGGSSPTTIWLQKSDSIQTRTRPVKFARSLCTDPEVKTFDLFLARLYRHLAALPTNASALKSERLDRRVINVRGVSVAESEEQHTCSMSSILISKGSFQNQGPSSMLRMKSLSCSHQSPVKIAGRHVGGSGLALDVVSVRLHSSRAPSLSPQGLATTSSWGARTFMHFCQVWQRCSSFSSFSNIS